MERSSKELLQIVQLLDFQPFSTFKLNDQVDITLVVLGANRITTKQPDSLDLESLFQYFLRLF